MLRRSSWSVIRLEKPEVSGEETEGKKVLQPRGLRINLVTEAKSGVGRRWLEGAGEDDPGHPVRGLAGQSGLDIC